MLKTFDLTELDAMMIPVGVILFFMLWKLLGETIFKPYLAVTEERERQTIGAESEASSSVIEAEKINNELDSKIQNAKTDAMLQKNEVLSKARKEASQLIAQAEEETQKFLQAKRTEIKNSQASAMKSNAELAKKLSDEIASKVTHQLIQ